MPSPRMEPIGECMVRAEDGVEYDVLVAIESLPWVSQQPFDWPRWLSTKRGQQLLGDTAEP
jgi:hypothetical protein